MLSRPVIAAGNGFDSCACATAGDDVKSATARWSLQLPYASSLLASCSGALFPEICMRMPSTLFLAALLVFVATASFSQHPPRNRPPPRAPPGPPARQRVGEAALSRRALLDRQNGALAVVEHERDVEPAGVPQQADIALQVVLGGGKPDQEHAAAHPHGGSCERGATAALGVLHQD